MALTGGVRTLAPAEHLIRLPDPDWALWRTVCVRGAGFPAAGVLRLADETWAAAADAWSPPRGSGAPPPAGLHAATERALERAATEIRRVLRTPRFREAVTWQNPGAVANFDEALAAAGRRVRAQRKNELKVASYWQRYTVKNDTIGYFGPVGWGRFVDGGERVSARPGPGLVRRREVFFEGWAMEALAETIAGDPRLRIWLPPRRLPFLHQEGEVVHRPFAPPVRLSAAEAAVLAACDGSQPARDVAALACRVPGSGLMAAAEVYRVLDALRGRGLLAWSLELPCRLRPEEELRRVLGRVRDDGARSWALGELATLEEARSAVAAAAGDPARLDAALAGLDRTFVRLTGREPSQGLGQTYAGRRLVYEDCRRDLDLDLGPGLLAALVEPLALVLAGARWVTHELARTYRQAFAEAYRAEARRRGSTVVDLAQFPFLSLLDIAGGRAQPVLDAAAERWASVLRVGPGRRAWRSSAELAPAVTEAFAAPGPGWPLARYQSPDLMIDAASVEAVRAGDLQLVLGEIHLAVNSILASCLVGQHPAPDELRSWVEADLGRPTVVPVIPKGWERMSTRTYPVLDSPRDLYLSLAADPGGHPASRNLPVSALVLEERDGALRVRTRDGALEFDLAEVFGLLFAGMLLNGFRFQPPGRHLPRIAVDRLVVCRESWTLPAAELAFSRTRDEASRLPAARAWARRQELPRFAFLRTPLEMKPVYVDFASPVYLGLFCKLVRAVLEREPEADITLTEMLPDPHHAWLPDGEGNRYTCELRMVAVDRLEPSPLQVR